MVLAGGLAVLLLAGCASGAERRSIAAADAAADRIAAAMTPAGRTFDVTGEYLVSAHVHEPDVAAVSWRGRSGDAEGDGARVVLRVHVPAERVPVTTVFGPDRSTAEVTRCYELAIRTWRYWDTRTVTGVGCPSTPLPSQPTGVRPDELPADAGARLEAIVADAGDAEEAAASVRRGFPRFVTVDATDRDGGMVVAVGAPAVHDCVVVQRSRDGRVARVGVDPVQAQPGELGCTVQLVTSPAR